ncbi:MAG: hypothetical protein K0A95_10695 [Chromatiales bacterium]|nr:hypothetical protein [Chromatiales bacterium]
MAKLHHLAPDQTGMLWLSDQHGLHYLDETGQPQLGLDATSATGSPQIVALGLAQGGSRAVWVAGQRSASLIDTTGIIQRRIDMNTLRGFGPILAVSHYADTTPPSIDIESPIDGSYLNHPELGIVLTYEDEGIGVDLRTLTLTINHHIANLSCEYSHNRAYCAVEEPLADGNYRLDAAVHDHAGNRGAADPVHFIIDTLAPELPIFSMMHIEYHEDGTVTLRGEAGAAEPHATLRVTNRRTGETITVTVGADGSFSATLRAEAGDELEIVVIDRAGNQSEKQNLTVGAASGQLPPDPASIAPPLDPTGFTSLLDATEFLYTGANPIQRDVAPGTIEARRAAVIRGRVQTRDGQALSGVTITLQGHPELGHTLSRADGMFDMVVNGGGLMVINYERDGYLPAQRKVKTPWQDYVWAEDVALIPLDPNATEITLGAAHMQVAQGSVEQDEDGQRQATILFPAGTQAELVMPDGTRQPLTSATVRATEYTVGPNGPKAMPGELPPTTAYLRRRTLPGRSHRRRCQRGTLRPPGVRLRGQLPRLPRRRDRTSRLVRPRQGRLDPLRQWPGDPNPRHRKRPGGIGCGRQRPARQPRGPGCTEHYRGRAQPTGRTLPCRPQPVAYPGGALYPLGLQLALRAAGGCGCTRDRGA